MRQCDWRALRPISPFRSFSALLRNGHTVDAASDTAELTMTIAQVVVIARPLADLSRLGRLTDTAILRAAITS